jgi:hypothetical protein
LQTIAQLTSENISIKMALPIEGNGAEISETDKAAWNGAIQLLMKVNGNLAMRAAKAHLPIALEIDTSATLGCRWLMDVALIQTLWALFMKALGNLTCNMATALKNGWALAAFSVVNSSTVLGTEPVSGFTTTRNMKANGRTT